VVTLLVTTGPPVAAKVVLAPVLVFCNTLGRGLDYRDVGEDFRQTLKRAGISPRRTSRSTLGLARW
jgi:hypothetical protein